MTTPEVLMLRKIISAALAGAVALAPFAHACTGIELTAKDGGVVAARTLEFGIDPKSEVMVVPAGTAITGTLPDGGKGISYVTKYGVVGANGFGQPVILDGINEAGLYVGLFYFPGYASYADATKADASRAMGPHEYGIWLLGNFANVGEVTANFDKVVLTPVVVAALKEVPPVHFVVHDRTGKSIVIEPVDNVLKLHENPLGVMTNSPTFDRHMTNLRNYVNLSATNVPPIALRDIKLAQFGEGSGMHGLPGDFTPPSRFVRAVAFSQAAIASDTAQQSVLQAFHILNNFDIPLGSVRQMMGGTPIAEFTAWTSASDLNNLRWHFRTYNDQSIRSIDLRAALTAANGKVRTISMDSQQSVLDLSTSFR
jgi:choloylglycine hydrolase